MKTDKFLLAKLFQAGFIYSYLTTWEEDRILSLIHSFADDETTLETPRKVFTWKLTTGITSVEYTAPEATKSPIKALEFIEKYPTPAIFVLLDFHVYFGNRGLALDFQVIRKLRDLASSLKQSPIPKNVVFVSPFLRLPDELQKEVAIVDVDLPSFSELKAVLQEMSYGVEQRSENDKDRLARAASGLNLQEAKTAFRQVIFKDAGLNISDVDVILEIKQQLVNQTNILELIKGDFHLDDVVGLNSLKSWLSQSKISWEQEAQKYSINCAKGLLITGHPGCGQNLIFKAIGAIWQLPILRLDLDKILGVNSEYNIRQAIKITEAIAPVILWVDEIEKGFSNPVAFNTFLTWMQKKNKQVFVAATAKNIELIPSSLLNQDYFDEIFFVDFPNHQERMELFRLSIKKRLKDTSVFGNIKFTKKHFAELAQRTEGFASDEIERVVAIVFWNAFLEDRSIQIDDFLNSIEKIVPYSLRQPEQIAKLEEWAEKNLAIRASTEILVKVDSDLIDSLNTICSRYSGSNYYVEHSLANEKLAAARAALAIPKTEKVIALIDTTIWKSQLFQGLAIGSQGIYWLNEEDSLSSKDIEKSIDWHEFAQISIKYKTNHFLELGKNNILWVEQTVLSGKTLDLLLEIQSLVRNHQLNLDEHYPSATYDVSKSTSKRSKIQKLSPFEDKPLTMKLQKLLTK